MEPRRRFKFLKELAQGGFGKVYLAEMITGDNFSSIVALKLLHGRWTSNDEIVMRSRDEARLLGRLRHRNIVRVEDLTSIAGQCAIVMEYLQGIDLKTAATALKEQGKPFPLKSAFEATGAIAAALDAAYTHRPLQGGEPLQVIHRDIKPSNAMITVEGDVKVLDFGTARATFEEREAKTQVLAFGSQAYMAPERMLGEPDGPSGDIFSLGITLYEVLTLDSFGKIPLRQERYEPTVASRLEAMEIAGATPELREAVLDCLRRMLAYEPEVRPSAAAVVEEMEALADMATDAGLKRFARESVRKVYDAWVPEQDPNDPYAGSLMFEDTTGPSELPRADDPAARPASEADEFQVPPELAELPVDLPTGSPAASAEAPAAYASPPRPPRVSSVMPSMAGGVDSPSGSAWPPPSQVDTAQRSAPRPKPASSTVSGATSAPTLARNTLPDEPAAASGGAAKIFVALGVVGVVGVVAALALSFALAQKKPTAPVIDVQAPDVAANLPMGTAEFDWAPNGKGKGGAILRVPDGANEVAISNSTGFRQEWDGSMNLRLRDIEPGSVRAKVKLRTGSTKLSDFAVEADKTCVFTLKDASWEKGECR